MVRSDNSSKDFFWVEKIDRLEILSFNVAWCPFATCTFPYNVDSKLINGRTSIFVFKQLNKNSRSNVFSFVVKSHAVSGDQGAPSEFFGFFIGHTFLIGRPPP